MTNSGLIFDQQPLFWSTTITTTTIFTTILLVKINNYFIGQQLLATTILLVKIKPLRWLVVSLGMIDQHIELAPASW